MGGGIGFLLLMGRVLGYLWIVVVIWDIVTPRSNWVNGDVFPSFSWHWLF